LATFSDCAIYAARAAGKHALHHCHRRRQVARRFTHDLKLVLDRECQTVAERIIRRRFPRHAILGEEDRRECRQADIRWIIDPIDGTINYFHGLPLWCCSIAVQIHGRSVAGAVYAPELDQCYTASAGRPALCNGKPIAVSTITRLKDALIATGIDKEPSGRQRSLDRFQTLYNHTQKMRMMGSAALDICHVACGKTEGFHESGVYLWDVAAGSLIVEQAGGRSEILKTGPGHHVDFLASNGRIHAALRKLAAE
jgi:myo-inositol-1(or 4)-monophosphatase